MQKTIVWVVYDMELARGVEDSSSSNECIRTPVSMKRVLAMLSLVIELHEYAGIRMSHSARTARASRRSACVRQLEMSNVRSSPKYGCIERWCISIPSWVLARSGGMCWALVGVIETSRWQGVQKVHAKHARGRERVDGIGAELMVPGSFQSVVSIAAYSDECGETDETYGASDAGELSGTRRLSAGSKFDDAE